MSRTDIDRAIDRYLDGAMGAAERTSFLAHVERDPEVARALAAERAIRSALATDRALLPIDRAAGRGELLSSLAALPAPPAPTSALSAGGTTSFAATAIGSVIVVAVTVVTMLTSSPTPHENQNIAPTPSRTVTELSVPVEEPAPAIAPVVVAGVDNVAARETAVVTRAAILATTQPAMQMRASSLSSAAIAQSEHTIAPNVSVKAPGDDTALEGPEVAELPVINRDSVDLEVRMGR